MPKWIGVFGGSEMKKTLVIITALAISLPAVSSQEKHPIAYENPNMKETGVNLYVYRPSIDHGFHKAITVNMRGVSLIAELLNKTEPIAEWYCK